MPKTRGFDERVYGQLPGNFWELPVRTLAESKSPDGPGPCLMETDDFVQLFNHWADRQKYPGWKITRRTLQFYSSPKLRVMPPPMIFEGRGHRGYYVVPEHLRRLFAIQRFKQKYFLPLWLIREIIAAAAPSQLDFDTLEVLGRLPTNEFLDILPFLTKTSAINLCRYQWCRSAIGLGEEPAREGESSLPAFRKHVRSQLESMKSWVDSKEGADTFDLMHDTDQDPQTHSLVRDVQRFKARLLRKK